MKKDYHIGYKDSKDRGPKGPKKPLKIPVPAFVKRRPITTVGVSGLLLMGGVYTALILKTQYIFWRDTELKELRAERAELNGEVSYARNAISTLNSHGYERNGGTLYVYGMNADVRSRIEQVELTVTTFDDEDNLVTDTIDVPTTRYDLVYEKNGSWVRISNIGFSPDKLVSIDPNTLPDRLREHRDVIAENTEDITEVNESIRLRKEQIRNGR